MQPPDEGAASRARGVYLLLDSSSALFSHSIQSALYSSYNSVHVASVSRCAHNVVRVRGYDFFTLPLPRGGPTLANLVRPRGAKTFCEMKTSFLLYLYTYIQDFCRLPVPSLSRCVYIPYHSLPFSFFLFIQIHLSLPSAARSSRSHPRRPLFVESYDALTRSPPLPLE